MFVVKIKYLNCFTTNWLFAIVLKNKIRANSDFIGAEGGIRTLATVTRPTSLAGKPLRPLEYFCIDVGYFNTAQGKCQTFCFTSLLNI